MTPPPEALRSVPPFRVAAGALAEAPAAVRARRVLVVAGRGNLRKAGVIDRLRQLGYDVVEVPFGGKATEPNQYINRRTEMWFEIKEWLALGGAIPNDNALKQELATPIYWFDAAGRKVLEPKDEIKKRLQGAGSPDLADALALTFAYPVQVKVPRHLLDFTAQIKSKPRDYDPYA